ncbi:MAG: hypothetical protein HYW90_05175 [Candidatus Sungbacteria bacterium]|nr:hypothetical protein [Candidatus Sungbacteria bacterium]
MVWHALLQEIAYGLVLGFILFFVYRKTGLTPLASFSFKNIILFIILILVSDGAVTVLAVLLGIEVIILPPFSLLRLFTVIVWLISWNGCYHILKNLFPKEPSASPSS